ncbi:MAG: sulfur oxidation c-type cytochrome SoxX [Pseudomonadota bacterium]
MRIRTLGAIGLACSGLLAGCASTSSAPDTSALVDQYVAESFLPGTGQDLSRLKQDQTQKDCTTSRTRPSDALDRTITDRETKNIVYPASGKLRGDWKAGAKIFNDGFAYRVGSFIPSNPKAVRGGNCYACHQGEKKEVAFGNLGTSLQGYGKLRGQSEPVVKYTYDKIFNAKAFNACSNMPRLGHNGILSPEQVADLTAYLIDPASPINQ